MSVDVVGFLNSENGDSIMNAIYVLLFLGAVTLFLFAGMFLAGALIGLARLCKEAMTALRATRAAPAATTPVVAAAGASASRHAS
jgi:hypothetical protein